MSERLDPASPMTGSTDAGRPQAQKDSLLVPVRSLAIELERTTSVRDSRRQSMSRKTTTAPGNAQPIQLTPLWEHVVRTRKFPAEIDTRLTFLEIAERLRDPEWEVRQHALRVLMDVLPTLDAELLDKVMQPVLPELINNLGHPAPAVRKGALDTIRVYLLHTQDKESIVKNILRDGLSRSEAHDPFQSNVTTGVILSAPSLLFPSSSSPSPGEQLVKDTTIALASRLAQVPHQEAVLKSLLKIRDGIGGERFDDYLGEYDDKLKKNIEILSKIYNIRTSRKRRGNSVSARNVRNNERPEKKEEQLERKWDSDSDTSGIVEEEDEVVNGSMPGARVVLETEIKFNEETAITMTILEEKAEDSETEQDEESGTDLRNDAEVAQVVGVSLIDRRKTPRRVHFGGEIVKLRTPDSDETESIELVPKTRIPLPVSPATKMPEHRRPSSQPCSPRRERKKLRRQARSASNSPKREVYIHNADLSPKKSILTRTNSPLYIIKPSDQAPKKRTAVKREEKDISKIKNESDTRIKEDNVKIEENSVQQIEEPKKENVLLVHSSETAFVPIESVETDNSSHKMISPNTVEVKAVIPKQSSQDQVSDKIEDRIVTFDSQKTAQSAQNKSAAFETFPRQERNYILMELSSPESKGFRENKDEIDSSVNKEGLTNKWDNATKSSLATRNSSIDVPNSPFGSVVDEAEIDRDFLVDLNINADTIDLSTSASTRITSGRLEANSAEVSADVGPRDLSAPDAIQGAVDSANGNIERRPLKEGDSERGLKSDGDQKIVACVVKKSPDVASEGECKSKEPNWEELGLVGTEVLEDLHNREDWRARVRGLERVASALRTSSALIAIEPRLGSLLHAVLGCERSCRVAAAGLAVAKVVVTGVGEDALKRRLSLLAWGLARQGGPSAAQLARIAMLRLRPILFLEQLLQPQCLNARNAKTRENALQLLIFSLVTFPSTEFRVEAVASKVVKMVADRRRRVRQAALDTLAVLAQIYDPEEVLAAAKKAADRRHDGEAMLSAVRARLARKSLPLVSADGLVVYGLQISPTVQIATGPDVDWIVAGSGSVSPGTGRTRGQIIATTGTDRGRITRTLAGKSRSSPWMERPSLGLSIGSAEEVEEPVAWQIVPTEPEDDTGYQDQLNRQDERNNNTETSAGDCSRNPPQQESAERRKTVESVEFRASAKSDEIVNRQPDAASKSESRIPILSTARTKTLTSVRDRTENLGVSVSSVIAGRRTFDNTTGFGGSAENMLGPFSTAYQRRKNYSSYNSLSKGKNLSNVHTSYTTSVEVTTQETPENISKNYRRLSEKERFVERSEEKLLHSQPVRTQQTTSSIQECTTQRQSGRFVDGTTFHRTSAPSRAMNGERQYYQNRRESIKNTSIRSRPGQRIQDAPHQKQNSAGFNSSEHQTNGHFPAIESDLPYRRRLRSLSPSQMYHRQQYVRRPSREYQTASMYDIDKAVDEEEYNKRNKILYFSDALDPQEIPLKSSATPAFEEDNAEGSISKSASNTSSEGSRSIDQGSNEPNGQIYETGSRSSTPQSHETQAAFNVITNSAGSAFRESVEPFVIPLERKLEVTVSGTISSVDEDASKYWSSEEDTNSSVRARTASRTEFHSVAENESNSTFEELEDAQEEVANVVHIRRRSVISILSPERVLANEDLQAPTEYPSDESSKNFQGIQVSPNRKLGSPKKLDILSSPQSLGNEPIISRPPTRSSSRGSLQKSIFDETNKFGQASDTIGASPTHRVENVSFQPIGTSSPSKERKDTQSPTIVIASRPHSNLAEEVVGNNLERRVSFGTVDNADRFLEESSINDTFDDRQSKDSASETNTEPAILRIESQTMEPVHPSRRMSSQMSRGPKPRTIGPRGVQDKAVEKSKAMVQQCFAQLENKDWEVALKGLKSLSQIAKQHPELLDLCGIGIIGRILGRLIKSLRSQVARAACQAAGDLFAAHIRSIDQDVDDIAGPLLHRTADTNRFLRGDCNTALDRMVEHLPPHKTFGIIIHRGGNHQNPVVRAAAARLLSALVDRVGPEHTMILPRDTRDKLLNTGARLLTDGNLDARNYAKKIFKRLTRCEGFRKALTDAVPDSTLRHMDKALKAL